MPTRWRCAAPLAAAIAVLSCAPARVPEDGLATGAPDVRVVAGSDWLEVSFPPLNLQNTGCPYPDSLPDGRVARWYQWRVTNDFADRMPYNSHFMGIYVAFRLPEAGPITDAALDSAIAAARITVDEVAGEPPMTVREVAPRSTRAIRRGGRLELRVEGRDAIRSFFRPGSDSVDVGWCQRDEYLAGRTVRVRWR